MCSSPTGICSHSITPVLQTISRPLWSCHCDDVWQSDHVTVGRADGWCGYSQAELFGRLPCKTKRQQQVIKSEKHENYTHPPWLWSAKTQWQQLGQDLKCQPFSCRKTCTKSKPPPIGLQPQSAGPPPSSGEVGAGPPTVSVCVCVLSTFTRRWVSLETVKYFVVLALRLHKAGVFTKTAHFLKRSPRWISRPARLRANSRQGYRARKSKWPKKCQQTLTGSLSTSLCSFEVWCSKVTRSRSLTLLFIDTVYHLFMGNLCHLRGGIVRELLLL